MTVPGVMLTWQQGMELAGLLTLTAEGLRRSPVRGRRTVALLVPVAREAALVSLLYGIWQLAHSIAITHVAGGAAHGRQVWDVERFMHLPNERSVQQFFLPHHDVVRFANLYYESVHFPATILLLAWLFIWHRSRYKPIRTTLALATAMSLLIQLIPVAPPRLIPSFGMLDTALAYGQSVYGADGGGIADQLGAMPSVHVLWCVLVGATVIRVGRSRWRYLVLLHTVGTILIVVLTANHYWMDGIVAVGLIGIAVLLQTAWRALVAGRPEVPADDDVLLGRSQHLEAERDVLELA